MGECLSPADGQLGSRTDTRLLLTAQVNPAPILVAVGLDVGLDLLRSTCRLIPLSTCQTPEEGASSEGVRGPSGGPVPCRAEQLSCRNSRLATIPAVTEGGAGGTGW